MANKTTAQYLPDYPVKPGEVLQDYLQYLQMTQAELSARTGLSKKTINEIVQGKTPITPESALKLELVLDRPAHFWNNLEQQYQEDRTRLTENDRLQKSLKWLEKVPVKVMIKFGWIPDVADKVAKLAHVLRFYGIVSPEQWQTVWQDYQVAYRKSLRFEPQAECISAWLRKGEIEAQKMTCQPFNEKLFQKNLAAIRKLSQETDPKIFVAELERLCAAAGVAVVFVPELPKTQICGATRWAGNKAVIQLSLRYKSNDQLWFTFFHEAGHILKHGRREIFLEGIGITDERENEADAFARDMLIPMKALHTFLANWDGISHSSIVTFSEKIGIAPGVLVGRLQHDGRLPRTNGNKLKVFYHWSEETRV